MLQTVQMRPCGSGGRGGTEPNWDLPLCVVVVAFDVSSTNAHRRSHQQSGKKHIVLGEQSGHSDGEPWSVVLCIKGAHRITANSQISHLHHRPRHALWRNAGEDTAMPTRLKTTTRTMRRKSSTLITMTNLRRRRNAVLMHGTTRR